MLVVFPHSWTTSVYYMSHCFNLLVTQKKQPTDFGQAVSWWNNLVGGIVIVADKTSWLHVSRCKHPHVYLFLRLKSPIRW